MGGGVVDDQQALTLLLIELIQKLNGRKYRKVSLFKVSFIAGNNGITAGSLCRGIVNGILEIVPSHIQGLVNN